MTHVLMARSEDLLEMTSLVFCGLNQPDNVNFLPPRPMVSFKGTEIFLQSESGTWGSGYFLGQISPVSILWL